MRLYLTILMLMASTCLADDETSGEIKCNTVHRGRVVYSYHIPPSHKDLIFFKTEAAPAMYSDVDRKVCLDALEQAIGAIHHDTHAQFTWYVVMHDISRACCRR